MSWTWNGIEKNTGMMVMSKLITLDDQPLLMKWINRCYAQEYQQLNTWDLREDLVLGFGNWCRTRYGIRLALEPQGSNDGQVRYGLRHVEILDPARWNWFVLTWGGHE